jgi:hypothetical protein
MAKSESLLVPKYHNIKAYRGMEVNFLALLTTALEAGNFRLLCSWAQAYV